MTHAMYCNLGLYGGGLDSSSEAALLNKTRQIAEVTRLDKAEYVADNSLAQSYLLVCETQENGENCSLCANCTRTMAEFDVLGKLGAFNKVFDVDGFYKNVGYHWGYVLLKGKGNDVFAKEIVDLYLEKNKRFPLKVRLAALRKWVGRGFTSANNTRRRVENEIR